MEIKHRTTPPCFTGTALDATTLSAYTAGLTTTTISPSVAQVKQPPAGLGPILRTSQSRSRRFEIGSDSLATDDRGLVWGNPDRRGAESFAAPGQDAREEEALAVDGFEEVHAAHGGVSALSGNEMALIEEDAGQEVQIRP